MLTCLDGGAHSLGGKALSYFCFKAGFFDSLGRSPKTAAGALSRSDCHCWGSASSWSPFSIVIRKILSPLFTWTELFCGLSRLRFLVVVLLFPSSISFLVRNVISIVWYSKYNSHQGLFSLTRYNIRIQKQLVYS